jgi:hypothetical protein
MGYRYGIWYIDIVIHPIDMVILDIDMVILDIDMGYGLMIWRNFDIESNTWKR